MLKRVFIGVLTVGCLSGCVQRDVVLEERASRLLALPPESSPFVRIVKIHVDRPGVAKLCSGFSIGDGLYVTAQHDMGDLSGWAVFVEGRPASVVRRSDGTPDWDDWMVLKVEGLNRPRVKLDRNWQSRPNQPFKVFGFDYGGPKSFEKLEDFLATPLVVVDCSATQRTIAGASTNEVVLARSLRGHILKGYSGAAAMGRDGVFAIHRGKVELDGVPGTFVLLRTIQDKPGALVWDTAD